MAQRLYNSRTQLHFMKQYILLKCPRYNKNIINYQHKFLMQSKWKLGFRGLFFFFFSLFLFYFSKRLTENHTPLDVKATKGL